MLGLTFTPASPSAARKPRSRSRDVFPVWVSVTSPAVGRLLATLGTRHQVLCVTHLAQVAAFADAQIVVEKAVVGKDEHERTVATATIVEGDARVAELSRMLAGVGES